MILQSVEGVLARVVPIPQGIFLCEIEERVFNVGVVANELPIEVGESQEGMNIVYLGWSGPIPDSIESCGVHFDMSWG